MGLRPILQNTFRYFRERQADQKEHRVADDEERNKYGGFFFQSKFYCLAIDETSIIQLRQNEFGEPESPLSETANGA